MADITQPIDDYNKIIQFDGSETSTPPKNPYNKGEKEFDLFNELVSAIEANFEEIGDELVFAEVHDGQNAAFNNNSVSENYIIDMEKVII